MQGRKPREGPSHSSLCDGVAGREQTPASFFLSFCTTGKLSGPAPSPCASISTRPCAGYERYERRYDGPPRPSQDFRYADDDYHGPPRRWVAIYLRGCGYLGGVAEHFSEPGGCLWLPRPAAQVGGSNLRGGVGSWGVWLSSPP